MFEQSSETRVAELKAQAALRECTLVATCGRSRSGGAFTIESLPRI